MDSPTPEMSGSSKKSIISTPTEVLNNYNIYLEYELGMGRLIVGETLPADSNQHIRHLSI